MRQHIAQWLFVAAAITSIFATSQVLGQASVFQDGNSATTGGDLGQSIQDLTQGIIAGTNEQVQNTLDNAGKQALPQLQQNASAYDCLIIVMNFGKAHGAMTCSPNQNLATGITVNNENAPSGSFQSSVQRQTNDGNSATSMQNSMTGSGSSANVIPGNVP